MTKSFEHIYAVGANSVEIKVEASWDTFGKGRWEFITIITVIADGRHCDSNRWSDVSANDITRSFGYLDRPQFPKETPPDILIGVADNSQLEEIAKALSMHAKNSYPSVSADEAYFGI